jgi:hypothetical protein
VTSVADDYGDPGIAWGEANAANDDGEAVMQAEREAGATDAEGLCEQHGLILPCAQCEADHESYLGFLHGQSRIAGLFAERVQKAQAAVDVLARYIEFEAREDKHEIGSGELADAAAGAGQAAVVLRGVRRVADLYAARVALDLAAAEAERGTRG